MPDDIANTQTATQTATPAAPAPVTPSIGVTPSLLPEVPDRLTVPVSALFDEAELTPPVLDGVEPTEAAKPTPADTKPTEAAKPTPADTKPTEAAKPTPDTKPAKIKVAGKEYTAEELEKLLLARSEEGRQQQAQAQAPAQPKPTRTPEQIAEAESMWCKKFSETEKINFAPSDTELETILSGGKEGVAALANKLNDVCTKAVLLARKSIYRELNPELQSIRQNVQPLVVNSVEVERAAAEHQFFTAYPEFKTHTELVRQVGEALLERYPQQ